MPSLRLRARRAPAACYYINISAASLGVFFHRPPGETSRKEPEHNTIIYRVEKSSVAENKTLPKRALAPERIFYLRHLLMVMEPIACKVGFVHQCKPSVIIHII